MTGIWAEHELEFLNRRQAVPIVSSDDLQDLTSANAALGNLQPDQSFIRNGLVLYERTFEVHDFSMLRVLAFFSVIELLVTHKPKQNNPEDSLLKQVKRKLSLLGAQFGKPMNPAQHFSVKDDNFAWGMIYNYRSLIAHGEEIDFTKDFKNETEDKGAKQLVDQEEVIFFLEEFTRRLLRHALKNPQTMCDLKKT